MRVQKSLKSFIKRLRESGQRVHSPACFQLAGLGLAASTTHKHEIKWVRSDRLRTLEKHSEHFVLDEVLKDNIEFAKDLLGCSERLHFNFNSAWLIHCLILMEVRGEAIAYTDEMGVGSPQRDGLGRWCFRRMRPM